MARIPAVQNSLQLDDAQLGISLLSTSVGAILAMPATGWLIREWGNPKVMRIAATVVCVSLPLLAVALLIGLATAYWMFRGRPPRNDREDKASP